MSYQSIELGPQSQTSNEVPTSAKPKLLLSHAITKVGSKAWEFATPLLLLNFNPKSLFAPVAFGLISSAAQLIFGPMIGSWADGSGNRLITVFTGCFIQGLTSALAIILLAALLDAGSSASNEGAWGGMSNQGVVLFLLLSGCGVAEALSANAVSVAIEKDWVPAIFDHSDIGKGLKDDSNQESPAENDELTGVNTFMSRIDLVAEFVGPLLAGFVLTFFIDTPLIGFTLIGFGNAATFVPQYFLLKSLHDSCERLQKTRIEEETLVESKSCISELVTAWPIWLCHPGGVPLVSVSYALLYFTVLSPHGIPLTAYLASSNTVDPFQLAVFRGLGAFAGIMGLSTFEFVKNGFGLRVAASCHIWFETFAVFLAAVSFASGNIWVFMLAVVLSRIGLYGFDVGFMELQQRQVEEKIRNAIGAVDNSLTSVATFMLFAVTLHVDSPEKFAHITWASALAVLVASLVFSVYLSLWHEHEHVHDDDEDTTHPHTTQQLRALENSRVHKHVHYSGFSVPCTDGHGHDHSHSHASHTTV